MNTRSKGSPLVPLFVALAAIVAVRLFTLNVPDLMDTTEGRYATVAKLMLERDDWVTPWLIYKGVASPYLGKPPLHFWLMEMSYLGLGYSNFSARLPGVITGAATCAVVGVLAHLLFGTATGLVAAMFLATSTLVFFLAGACVLDVTLTLGITLALVAFALADRSRWWGYLCFVGLGIGVLVKGPLAVVLAGLTIAPWIAIQRYLTGRWPEQWMKLPLVTGTSIFLLIVVPWYLWAELRNPGFLHYFIWTENLGRYFEEEYGDKYGTGHQQPFGTVWAMMIPSFFPWILFALALIPYFLRRVRAGAAREWLQDKWIVYFALWTLGCPALLTFATQYTATYLVPVGPGFALLAALLWHRWSEKSSEQRRAGIVMLFTMLTFLSLVVLVGSFISLFFEGTMTNAIIASAIGAAMLGYTLTAGRRLTCATQLVAMVGLYTAAAYGLASLCFDNHLSNSRSTRRILTEAASLAKPGETLTVGFRGDLPFSASFYKDLIGDGTLEVVGVYDHELKETKVPLLAVRGAGIKDVRAALPHAQLVKQTGRWQLLDLTGKAKE